LHRRHGGSGSVRSGHSLYRFGHKADVCRSGVLQDKRQGLHGKEFNCLKFRTMITGAHEIQQKLRAVSQVDGPQFKMADDPRINTVGDSAGDLYR